MPPKEDISSPTDKIYGITNIKSYVPLTLDLDKLNYDAWHQLFKTHCVGYKVFDHLEPSPIPDGAKAPEKHADWDTVDAIVKQWIYGTLTQPLL